MAWLHVVTVVCVAVVSVVGDGSFKGKVVAVTGGTSGIGLATVMAFAREGAKVAFCARDAHPEWYNGSSAMATINSDPLVQAAGGESWFYKADVSVMTEVRGFINSTVGKFGDLHVAVNDAGIAGWTGYLDEIPDDVFGGIHDPLQTNLYGLTFSAREEVRYWRKVNHTGTIVNIASLAGEVGFPQNSLYGMAKHGVIGLTQALAAENARGNPYVRVNCICPGWIDTPMVRNGVKNSRPWVGPVIHEDDPRWQWLKKYLGSTVPVGRVGRPEEIASIAVFLSGEGASYMTGECITADGGILYTPMTPPTR